MYNGKENCPSYKSYPYLRTNYDSIAEMSKIINRSKGYISNRFCNPIAHAFTANDQHLLLLGMGWKDTPENREKVFENGRQRGIDYQLHLQGRSDEAQG